MKNLSKHFIWLEDKPFIGGTVRIGINCKMICSLEVIKMGIKRYSVHINTADGNVINWSFGESLEENLEAVRDMSNRAAINTE